MYQPTTRVLTVLELLQTCGQVSSAELASRLEVTPRSVRRYITMLQDLGIPVESERGRYGGYHLRPGFKLPPLMFTNEEALAITLGLLSTKRLGLTTGEPTVEGALAKLERVLPESVRLQVQSVHDALVLDDAPRDAMTQSATVMTMSQAVKQSRRVWLRYAAPGGESARAIDPYGLVFRDGHWYAVGWCYLREAIRIFRLDRVLKLRMLSSTFELPSGSSARELVTQTLNEQFEQSQVELLLETSINEARQWIPAIMANLHESPEGVVLTSNTGSLDWMAWFIAGLPCPVRIRRPYELVQKLEQLASRLASIVSESGETVKEDQRNRGRLIRSA